jgi:hypothetical protein
MSDCCDSEGCCAALSKGIPKALAVLRPDAATLKTLLLWSVLVERTVHQRSDAVGVFAACSVLSATFSRGDSPFCFLTGSGNAQIAF